jgi:deferrochelatase/peroxidase EfeB
VTATDETNLELGDIQAGALFERPSPYVGTYLLLRIDDRADGRELVRRLHRIVNPAHTAPEPAAGTSITVAFTYTGLQALGVPQVSLDSFAPEFREGMAARAGILGDTGESSPEHWEKPLGTGDVHVAIAALSPDPAVLRIAAERAWRAQEEIPGVQLIWRQECYRLPTGRTSFGFKDGIGQPAVEGRSADQPSQPSTLTTRLGPVPPQLQAVAAALCQPVLTLNRPPASYDEVAKALGITPRQARRRIEELVNHYRAQLPELSEDHRRTDPLYAEVARLLVRRRRITVDDLESLRSTSP